MHRRAAALAFVLLTLSGCASEPAPAPGRWWDSAVFYEVFVRSFKDSSTGPLAGDGIGDIPGLIEKLDYLNDGDPRTTTDLGVTGLWLMPIHPSPSYHGYDVTDYCAINPQYGTLEDFKRLVGECHKRGIRVVLDLVLNHCSNRHPWFLAAADPASDKRDWFIWSNDDPGWKGLWNQKVWHPLNASDPRAWYFGMFSSHMPDLNCRNQQVTDELMRVADFWIDESISADGYRLDAIRHLIEDGRVHENTAQTHAWLRGFQQRCKRASPECFTIGEVWSPSEIAATYVGEELDAVFEFDLAAAIVESARTGKAKPALDAQVKVQSLYARGGYGRFLTNHDQTRVMTALKGDAGAMRVAAALLLLGPGIPFVYYGEELGMTGDKPDELLRTPMQWAGGTGAGFTTGTPWQKPAAGFEVVNVERQSTDGESLLNWYRRLIRLRAEEPALACGGFTPLQSDNAAVHAFVRIGERPVLVVINLGGEPAADVTLSAASSPLRGRYLPCDLQAPRACGTVRSEALVVGEVGGFDHFRPRALLNPYETGVWALLRQTP